MLWSPGLVDRAPLQADLPPASAHPPTTLEEALEMYVGSCEPGAWERRRLAAAYLLQEPLSQRARWERVGARLERAARPPSAWQCWQRFATSSPPARGLFGAYQNRLSGLRRRQLQATAERLRPVLEKDDYPAYLQSLPRLGESSGPLRLALTLQPENRIGREELLPHSWWWAILLNQSNEQALRAGIRLAGGKTPEMPHRWDGRTCVCWSPGPDGRDDAGLLEASFQQPDDQVGDWIYRFRL